MSNTKFIIGGVIAVVLLIVFISETILGIDDARQNAEEICKKHNMVFIWKPVWTCADKKTGALYSVKILEKIENEK